MIALLAATAAAAPVEKSPSAPQRNVQLIQASVTIIAVQPVDIRTPPARGSAHASEMQYRQRGTMPLVEFF